MKKLTKIICLALILILAFSCGIFAKGTLEEIKAYINYGITISYNGQTQTVANRIIDIKLDKVVDREVTYNEYLGIE